MLEDSAPKGVVGFARTAQHETCREGRRERESDDIVLEVGGVCLARDSEAAGGGDLAAHLELDVVALDVFHDRFDDSEGVKELVVEGLGGGIRPIGDEAFAAKVLDGHRSSGGQRRVSRDDAPDSDGQQLVGVAVE